MKIKGIVREIREVFDEVECIDRYAVTIVVEEKDAPGLRIGEVELMQNE